jgi:IS30 family transposase
LIIRGRVVVSSKKGPGRRPLSAKRQPFVELRGLGHRLRAAAGAAGGADIGARFLSHYERIEIAHLRRPGLSMRQVTKRGMLDSWGSDPRLLR